MAASLKELVCAIHPTYRGFGWCLFEAPSAPVDWGIASAKPGRTARSIARFERILKRYKPHAVVFEEFERHPARRGEAIKELCRAMIHLAQSRGSHTPIYGRDAVRTCFASMGGTTRYEIAQTIVQHIPEFQRRLPRKRRDWTSEDFRQCLFDAASLAMTHFAVTGHEYVLPIVPVHSGAPE